MGIIKLNKKNQNKNNTHSMDNKVEKIINENIREKKWDDPAILYEDESLTDAYSRHYILNNRTRKMVISNSAMNYYDENDKKWNEIDNTLIDDGDVYVNKCGRFKTEISKTNKGKGIKISDKDFNVAWEYLGKKHTDSSMKTVLSINPKEKTKHKSSNIVLYKNVENNSDLEYVLNGNNIKENIIVKEKSETYEYKFALKTNGLKMRLSSDNESIELFSESLIDGELSEKVELIIPAPYMYDFNGKTSDEVYYEVDSKEDGQYTFSVVASAEWINDEERAFPVVIDPQIITTEKKFIETIVEYKITSNTSSGIINSEWIKIPSSNIKIYKNSSVEYRTTIKINKDLFSVLEDKISKVVLNLTPTNNSAYNGPLLVNNNFTHYREGVFSIDITSDFNQSTSVLNVVLTALSPSVYEFDITDNPPTLEIEYLSNENVESTYKFFDLAGVATGQLNLTNGDFVTTVCDIPYKDSVMGIEIAHVYKRGNEDNYVGNNFRLNLNEKLVKTTNSNYIYTDSKGMKYGFRDFYYYLDSNNDKVYIDDKASIEVLVDGSLKYCADDVAYKVEIEYKSKTGLKAITEYDGFKNLKYLEQRSSEQKQLEEQFNNYNDFLKEYTILTLFDTEPTLINYCLKDYLDNPERFALFINLLSNPNYIPVTFSEALNIKSICSSINSLGPQETSVSHQMAALLFSKESMDTQIDSINNSILSEESYVSLSEQERINAAMIEACQTQKTLAGEQHDNNMLIRENLLAQKALLEEQVDYFVGKKQNTIALLEKYYKEYYNLKEKIEQNKLRLPVNYLTDGKVFKGYNESGDLIIIFDLNNNFAAIEYEKYPLTKTTYVSRISYIHDNKNNIVTFHYNMKNQLAYIVDVYGKRVNYSYSKSNNLSEISYEDGKKISFDYINKNITEIKETTCGLKTRISYVYNRPVEFLTSSLIGEISNNINTADTSVGFKTIKVDYSSLYSLPIGNVKISNDGNEERFYFDDDGNKIKYELVENGIIVEAEKYMYTPYWIGNEKQSNPQSVVIYAHKDCLYQPKSSFSFVEGDKVTITLDQFNNAVQKKTSAITISSSNTETITVDYTYDNNQQLIEEKTTIEYSSSDEPCICYKKYNYNLFRDVIRIESYIEGFELSQGKTIEEIVYDANGNICKSFSYNSLDSSSKFYKEVDYNEDGQVVEEYDAFGNKIKFNYKDGTNIVSEEVLPNNSKFGYGYDLAGKVTAITQSTEDGECNYNQKVYNSGEIVKLVSGNNDIRYTYDYKRRLTSIDLDSNKEYATFVYDETVDSTGLIVDKTITATYKDDNVYESKYDGLGNLLTYKVNDILEIQNVYNNKKLLINKNDIIYSQYYTYERDDFDKLVKVYLSDNSETKGTCLADYSYNEYGLIAKKVVTLDSLKHEYNYEYKDDSTKKLESIKFNTQTKFKTNFDVNNRVVSEEIYNNNIKVQDKNITYYKLGDHATNLPSTIVFNNNERIKYTYDCMGNIEKVYENSELVVRYQYDALSRLIREDNKALGQTVLFSYDNNGNILKQRCFEFTLKDNILLEELESIDKEYVYNRDKLLSCNGLKITYDETFGNPLTYGQNSFTWNSKRKLIGYNNNTFNYDSFGRRITKNNIEYIYDDSGNLLKQSNGLEFFYDHDGVAGFIYNSAPYYYRKNAQQDVIAILDIKGEVVVKYLYDGWGNHTVVDLNGNEISDFTHIGYLNPFRYRGYYYDVETGLFWLSSRYYSPELCRFISPDSVDYLDSSSINGLNLYAYCNNDPINYADPSGHVAISIGLLLAIGGIVGAVIGAGASVAGQYLANGCSWENFSWGQLALDTVLGGVSGMLSMSPLGWGTMIAANAGIGFVGAVGGHLINGSDFSKLSTWVDIGLSTGLGALVGVVGGPGALNAGYLNGAKQTAGFIRAAGLYDDVLTKAVTGFYRTPGIASNALRLSSQNLVKQWNKMVVSQAGKALTKALAYGGTALLIGTAGKGWLYDLYNDYF